MLQRHALLCQSIILLVASLHKPAAEACILQGLLWQGRRMVKAMVQQYPISRGHILAVLQVTQALEGCKSYLVLCARQKRVQGKAAGGALGRLLDYGSVATKWCSFKFMTDRHRVACRPRTGLPSHLNPSPAEKAPGSLELTTSLAVQRPSTQDCDRGSLYHVLASCDAAISAAEGCECPAGVLAGLMV